MSAGTGVLGVGNNISNPSLFASGAGVQAFGIPTGIYAKATDATFKSSLLMSASEVAYRYGDRTKKALGEMKQLVDSLAGELDLPPGLLCPRKALEEYVVTAEWPEFLEGWRRDVLHDRLVALLPG